MTSDQPPQPTNSTERRWDDPLDTIAPERQAELRALADRQRTWVAQEQPDPDQSAFKGVRLTGADAFFVAAYALAGPGGDLDAHAARLRAGQQTDVSSWIELSALHLEGVDLGGAHLEGATLIAAHLQGAALNWAHLEGADMRTAHLEGASLIGTNLRAATLRWAWLEGTYLGGAHLEGANLHQAHLERASLIASHLETATLSLAFLEGADLHQAHLEGVDLHQAHLEGANLRAAHLEGALLKSAHLEGRVRQDGDPDVLRVRHVAKDYPAQLPPADLRGAFFDDATDLNDVTLGEPKGGYVSVADLRWRGANLAVVNWPTTMMLGDERIAREQSKSAQTPAGGAQEFSSYQAAVRANRQLAVALQVQGLNEEASRFAYHAQVLQQHVLWRQRKIGSYLFSRFLDSLAGFGYKPVRSLIAYLLLVVGFAAAYYGLGLAAHPHLQWYEALVVSLTAFHGRGFFAQQFSPGDPQAIIAAVEAVVGLLIEISFIATFTQRYFGAK